MKIENPIAYSFIMQDEVYLLNKDKTVYSTNIVSSAESAPVLETQPVNFNYLGKHKKHFLVIVHYPDLEFINDKHLTALENIFKRLELSIDDVAILNSARHNDVTFEQLADFFKPQKLLLLGKNSLPDTTETLMLNTPQKINNCDILFSFSFDEMMDNNEYKKAFWEQMKQL
jgi:DNA polymerase III psi subunit